MDYFMICQREPDATVKEQLSKWADSKGYTESNGWIWKFTTGSHSHIHGDNPTKWCRLEGRKVA